jgi:hypothetical protein
MFTDSRTRLQVDKSECCVVITDAVPTAVYNVTENSEELIGTTEYISYRRGVAKTDVVTNGPECIKIVPPSRCFCYTLKPDIGRF